MRDYHRLTMALAWTLGSAPYNVTGYTLQVPYTSNSLMPFYFVPTFNAPAPPTVQRGSTDEAVRGLMGLTNHNQTDLISLDDLANYANNAE